VTAASCKFAMGDEQRAPAQVLSGLIEVVEKLRHFLGPTGVNKLKLPEVVVLGRQSEGKSSILNYLIGKDDVSKHVLTATEGLTTKITMRVTLLSNRHVDETTGRELDWFAAVTHKTADQPDQVQEFCDPMRLREHIETFQNDREVLDGNVYFNIKCYSSTYKYPFTLVDLPGLPGNSSDQNYRAALDMALKHIRDLEGCVVMNVSQAVGNHDLGNDAMFGFLENDVGWQKERIERSTIRVFTMIDTATSAQREKILKTVLSEEAQRRYPQGTFIVINQPDAREIFKSDTGFEPYQACCGHDKLAQRISTLQLQAAQDSVPSMERGIDDAIKSSQEKLRLLGDPLPDTDHSRAMYFSRVMLQGLINQLNNKKGFRDDNGNAGQQKVVKMLQAWADSQTDPTSSSLKRTLTSLDSAEDWYKRVSRYVNSFGDGNAHSRYNKSMSLANEIQREVVHPTLVDTCCRALDDCFSKWSEYCEEHLQHILYTNTDAESRVMWDRMPELRNYVEKKVKESVLAAKDNANGHLQRTLDMYDYVWEFHSPEELPLEDGQREWNLSGSASSWGKLRAAAETEILRNLGTNVLGGVPLQLASGALEAAIETAKTSVHETLGKLWPAEPSRRAALSQADAANGHRLDRAQWKEIYNEAVVFLKDYNERVVWSSLQTATVRIVHTYLLREYSANLWKMDKDIQKELETGDTLKKLMQENPETQQQRGELISMIAQLEDCKRTLAAYKRINL